MRDEKERYANNWQTESKTDNYKLIHIIEKERADIKTKTETERMIVVVVF